MFTELDTPHGDLLVDWGGKLGIKRWYTAVSHDGLTREILIFFAGVAEAGQERLSVSLTHTGSCTATSERENTR